MRTPRRAGLGGAVAAALAGALLVLGCSGVQPLEELPEPPWALLESLSLAALRPPPPVASNAVADDPRAAELGHRLFFDPVLSSNGAVSCASCHDPQRYFTDGLARSQGLGQTARSAPTVVGSAHAQWLFWDGRRDSLWAQALGPLETDVEMDGTRLEVVRWVAVAGPTAGPYRQIFGSPPALAGLPERAGPFGDPSARAAWSRIPPAQQRAIDRAFANVGKALEAYQRRLQPAQGRFDRFVAARDPGLLDARELRGLRLFVDAGRTQCLQCHNGPLLSNQSFHRIATSQGAGSLPDFGRYLGLQAVLLDPFNCLGAFSDAPPDACGALRFVRTDHVNEEIGKFKTPTLRGLAKTAPYMHDGRFATLREVVDHYRAPPGSPETHELRPLDLSDAEAEDLVAFLGTLGAEVAAEPRWLSPPEL